MEENAMEHCNNEHEEQVYINLYVKLEVKGQNYITNKQILFCTLLKT